MILFFQIIGAVCCLLICVVLLFWAFYAAVDKYETLQASIRDRHYREARNKIRSEMIRDSWWFSDHEPTRLLFQTFAEVIVGNHKINDVRDDWLIKLNGGDQVKKKETM